MFYEEKVVGDVLCYRISPYCAWIPLSNKELTKRLEDFERLVNIYESFYPKFITKDKQ